jgi:Flp pilus assembly protein TadB
MGLAKKLLVCKECGAMNPSDVFDCRSCSSPLRRSPVNDSRAAREKLAQSQSTDTTERRRADEQRSIWQTEHRGRVALNLVLIALFAFILAMDLSTGASALNIAVVVVFLALSTTRFIYTWRKIRREQQAGLPERRQWHRTGQV